MANKLASIHNILPHAAITIMTTAALHCVKSEIQ